MEGKLLVISGFSGSGKGTIVNKLLEEDKKFTISVSATTRKKREGEIDGKSYFFVTKDEFENMIKNDEFLEHAKYLENYYGTPKEFVFQKLKEGKNVILEIEFLGAFQVKESFPDSMLFFIVPPSAKVLYERLVKRNTESMDQIHNRFKRALLEAQNIYKYDYVIENDDLDDCVKLIKKIVRKELKTNNYDMEKINKFIKDVKEQGYV